MTLVQIEVLIISCYNPDRILEPIEDVLSNAYVNALDFLSKKYMIKYKPYGMLEMTKKGRFFLDHIIQLDIPVEFTSYTMEGVN